MKIKLRFENGVFSEEEPILAKELQKLGVTEFEIEVTGLKGTDPDMFRKACEISRVQSIPVSAALRFLESKGKLADNS